jgi:formylglycine-generating enzyme
LINCNGTCIDPNTNNQHCGATASCDADAGTVGVVCASGYVCSGAKCGLSCQTGLVNCSGMCVNLNSDNSNCGACGHACPGESTCHSGVCSASCAVPLTCAAGDCCSSPLVSGGTFPMGRSAAGTDACPGGQTCWADEQPEHNVTVSSFHLDAYEVTVGRFRRYVRNYSGPPAAGAGAHPAIAGSGWNASWNSALPPDQASLIAGLKCDGGMWQTWTDTPTNENYPINCVNWYQAFAFCAWDGGRLPTEAEWEFAAAGGSENRLFPWGSANIDATRADWASSAASSKVAVGSYPAGNGLWGHADLAGSLYEWVFDYYDAAWYGAGGSSCTDCANTTAAINRVDRGGGFDNNVASFFRSTTRYKRDPTGRGGRLGFRCAR